MRAGLLCVPEIDHDALSAVRQALSQVKPMILVVQEAAARSQRNWIEEILRRWCDEEELDLVITIGGTLPAPGPSAAEITPEATLGVVERLLPGLPEAMRAHAEAQTSLALLDRGVAGIRSRTLILNLPAGAAPAVLFLEAVLDLISPLIAHLQEQPSAPRLADVLTFEAATSSQVRADTTQPLDSLTVQPLSKGLNAAEFAEFLQQRDQA